MPTLRTRSVKTSALTQNELDANFVRTLNAQVDTYQILISDNRSIVECNKATPFTVTLPPVATAAAAETNDFEVTVTVIGAGTVTVDGSGAELIDGSADLALQQWASATFLLDSAQTGWKTVAKSNVLSHVGALTVTGALTASGGVDGVLGGVTPALVTGTTIEATGDTSAGDNAAMGYTATEGLILTGQGSTNDITIKNDADADVMTVATGTVNATFAGIVAVGEGTASNKTAILDIDASGIGDSLIRFNNQGTVKAYQTYDWSESEFHFLADETMKFFPANTLALTLDASQNATFAGDVSVPTKTPASAGATGTTGTITWDANYIYVCTATNTWKRTAIATW